MYLFINTASAEKIIIGLIDKQGKFLIKKSIQAKYRQSEKFLLSIEKLLGNKLKKIKGIIAVKGPGSFSALRVGLTMANTMAWALQIPIIGIGLDKARDEKLINQGFNRLKKIKKFKPVMPEYGMQPNISSKAVGS